MSAARVPSYLLLLILLGLLGMFAAAFMSLTDLGDTSPPPQAAATRDADASNDPSQGLNDEQAGSVSALMRKLQANPSDADALIEIGEIFIAAQEWPRAEVFLTRAVLSRPADIRPRYLLGIAQYRQERMEEAAKTFEELLGVQEDPDAMFNLAVIYKYHLHQPERAAELLEKTAASPEAGAQTRAKARRELEKKDERP